MPSADMTVYRVQLSKRSSEYKDVVCKFQATTRGVNIEKIERIQNPHLYQCYTVKKQKMDKDVGGNSERQLFHGTDARNVTHINTQGFNRIFCGEHGKWFNCCFEGAGGGGDNETNGYDGARFGIYLGALSIIRNPWIPSEREKIID